MAAFDLVASRFERHRALPDAATQQIRDVVLSILGPVGGAAVLDLGAGTGRLGRAFLIAKDRYVGLDRSFAMLGQFRITSQAMYESHPLLVQAEGSLLPFRNASFSGVLLAHVLSASPSWRELLVEARRVLDTGGVLFLVQRVGPADGLDARLREQLKTILAAMDVEMPEAGRVKSDARTWLVSISASHERVVAARWMVNCAPSDFLERHSTGVRFAALPLEVQRESMRRLGEWAASTFGGLDASFAEEHAVELDAFRF
jgi:ubiquinone/menaquinone biosynthesis C-methylase UbiE